MMEFVSSGAAAATQPMYTRRIGPYRKHRARRKNPSILAKVLRILGITVRTVLSPLSKIKMRSYICIHMGNHLARIISFGRL